LHRVSQLEVLLTNFYNVIPFDSLMSLSPTTQEHLDDAKSSLRSALVSASRNERPATIQAIADCLSQIDKLSTVDQILDSLDSLKQKWRDKE